MCVAVDFGTVLSGVACGLSSDTVEQILWPGPNRKVLTSLIYDARGRVVAWGHRFQAIELEKGWIRCEMFKLLLDPNGASDLIPRFFPLGKGPIDVITDYLRELWQNAKPRILMRGYTKEALPIPATWNVRNGEMMRDAAYAAGLVAPEGSQEYAGGRDRLHIISEPEAGAVHCLLWKDLNLKPGQSFMVCNAGGGSIDTAIYRLLGDVTQIEEQSASSGASCGSHFLDIYFRVYLEEWHRTRNILLSEMNLTRYMHAFTYSQKLQLQENRTHWICVAQPSATFSIDIPALSDDEFFNGQLVVPVNDLKERVFDPVVDKVLGVLEAQLQRVDSVDALLLVGGFSANPYLLNRIRDIATSLGATQYGLTESLIRRHKGAPRIIASKSYIIDDDWLERSFQCSGLVVKGAVLRKGEPVLQEFTKTSSSPSDSVFIARVYTSDSAEIRPDTSRGDLEHIQDWEIDLSDTSLFKQNARNSPRNRFDTVFEIGIEIASQEAHVVWFCDGRRGRAINATWNSRELNFVQSSANCNLLPGLVHVEIACSSLEKIINSILKAPGSPFPRRHPHMRFRNMHPVRHRRVLRKLGWNKCSQPSIAAEVQTASRLEQASSPARENIPLKQETAYAETQIGGLEKHKERIEPPEDGEEDVCRMINHAGP
ncbi:hypothetical protein BS47DRAFT_1402134 [Hydnum rufescens UP504]|uniref:Actin-like ATPase domain-containing protein n=1 Tax=Hydnum rufescens UP504 TaxID=1448309 RepID=A0A9P6ADG8_9AGAM|nr:hypothetical protein BS47DRAFT_1402134 [Hydnum rufescens UP504]